MKFTRQQHVALMSFGDFDRPMFSELFGPLIGLPEEWKTQGAGQEEIDMVAYDRDYVPYVDCVSLENYRYYVSVGREILRLPPLDDLQKGWGRMAF